MRSIRSASSRPEGLGTGREGSGDGSSPRFLQESWQRFSRPCSWGRCSSCVPGSPDDVRGALPVKRERAIGRGPGRGPGGCRSSTPRPASLCRPSPQGVADDAHLPVHYPPKVALDSGQLPQRRLARLYVPLPGELAGHRGTDSDRSYMACSVPESVTRAEMATDETPPCPGGAGRRRLRHRLLGQRTSAPRTETAGRRGQGHPHRRQAAAVHDLLRRGRALRGDAPHPSSPTRVRRSGRSPACCARPT